MTLKEQFDQDGFVGPIEIMDRVTSVEYMKQMISADIRLDLMNSPYRCKSNVLFKWVDEISRNPILLSLVTQLIGPNVHCWDTLFWIKKSNDNKEVSFHQDATYWNFDNKDRAVTAWIALNDVTEEHGSIEYIKGSHRSMQLEHIDIKTDTNLLMRGQTVNSPLSGDRIKTSVPAGNVLLHSPYMIHGSGPNRHWNPRMALGMIFVSTECKPVLDISPESTVMVSGTDDYNYMLHDPQPTGDFAVDVENWQAAYDRQHANYYKMEQTL